MIHGYHTIFGTYGFWLPNDPRGSWSEFVGAWELLRFGRATKSHERRQLNDELKTKRQRAKQALKFPAVQLTGLQARAVGRGFANAVDKSNGLEIWACSILPEHIHVVVGRHNYPVEQIGNLLKGAATKQLTNEDLHPLAQHTRNDGRTPSPWAVGKWKVYLDSEESIEAAIRYVEENPVKEGKPRQTWSVVRRFSGLDPGWVTYH